MYQYGQYCPVARAAEILGDRWTLLIVRDLLTGTRYFNALKRGLPGSSGTLLADRLRRLQDVGVVEKRSELKGRSTTEYLLTTAGSELRDVVHALLMWGAKWGFGEPRPEELDPILLLWWMRSRIHIDRLPAERIVVEFDFRGVENAVYWLMLTRKDVSVCLQHPGHDVDVVVTADLASFYEVWLGRLSYDDARRANQINVDALPALACDFPNWFAWSAAAEAVRAAMLDRDGERLAVSGGGTETCEPPLHLPND